MFRMVVFTAVVIMSAATSCAVEVDGIAREHRPIVVKHDAGVIINVLYWEGGQPKLLSDDHLIRMDDRTIWSAPAGTYAVIQQGSAIVQVTRDGSPRPSPDPSPNPSPDPEPQPDPPNPDPEPQPDPEPDKIMAKWLVVIEEQSERHRHPDFFTHLLSEQTRNLLSDLGISFRMYDDDQMAAQPYLQTAGDRRPALILMDETGSRSIVTGPVTDIEAWIRGNIVR